MSHERINNNHFKTLYPTNNLRIHTFFSFDRCRVYLQNRMNIQKQEEKKISVRSTFVRIHWERDREIDIDHAFESSHHDLDGDYK